MLVPSAFAEAKLGNEEEPGESRRAERASELFIAFVHEIIVLFYNCIEELPSLV